MQIRDRPPPPRRTAPNPRRRWADDCKVNPRLITPKGALSDRRGASRSSAMDSWWRLWSIGGGKEWTPASSHRAGKGVAMMGRAMSRL